MTLSTTTSRIAYAGDGTTASFAIPFPFIANAHIQAVLRSAAGVETAWVENTHYTLAGAGNPAGGTLSVITAPVNYTPAAGETLTLRRVVPLTQETDYPEGGSFPAAAHEDALDKLTMIAQQVNEGLSRCLQYPVSDAAGLSAALPGAAARANQFLRFDADGKPGVAAVVANAIVSAFMQTVLDDADAAAARATLGLAIGSNVQAFHARLADIAGLAWANGDLLYFDGTLKRLAKGADGQVLKLAAGLPGWANQTGVLTASFTSAAQTITTGGLRTIAHGLGAKPRLVQIWLKNLTGEHGYSAGDEIRMEMMMANGRGAAIYADATNINIRYSDIAAVFEYHHKTSGTLVTLTNGNWELYVEAFA